MKERVLENIFYLNKHLRLTMKYVLNANEKEGKF